MRTHQQIVNPRQQPGRRHYNREQDQYDIDEMRDAGDGSDFYTTAGHRVPNGYSNRDYSGSNYRFAPFGNRPLDDSSYTPSRDYGYDEDEYYPMDHRRHDFERHEAQGYGNYNSVQGRDFERWMHGDRDDRGRIDFSQREFERRRHPHNRDFEEGMYDYHQSQSYHGPHGYSRRDEEEYGMNGYGERYHNREQRSEVIVRPFKRYGHNDLENSRGFGNNEMVYHSIRDRR